MLELINDDCFGWLKNQNKIYKCIFLDPPDNLGLNYSGYSDNLDKNQYLDWLGNVIVNAITRCEICWISYNSIYDLFVKSLLYNLIGESERYYIDTFIWYFTFGQYNSKDCGSSYRPIVRIMKKNAILYPEMIKEYSRRQFIQDNRTDISMSGMDDSMKVPSDVWNFPRVVGNAAERRNWHPVQHPEDLMRRIIMFSCKENSQDIFVDLFVGSGTSLIVAKKMIAYGKSYNVIGIQNSTFYCQKINEELDKI